MKPIKIKLGERLFTSTKITAWMAREAIATHKEALSLSKVAKEIQETKSDVEAAFEILEKLEDLATRKANLICEAYGNKFTVDELEKELSREEIDAQLEVIMTGIESVLSKN